MAAAAPTIIAVALNPAIDRTLHVTDLAIGSHVRGRLVSIQPAGKAVNVARLLGSLGTPCILTGFVGEGDRERFEKSLAKLPVRVEMFEGHEPTRENITLVDPQHNIETHIRDVGSALSEEDLDRLSRKLAILANKGTYVIFAGSLTPGMDVAAFSALLEVCRDKGAYVAVDSSGPGLETINRTPRLWLVKPNREELSQIAGKPVLTEEDVRAVAEPLIKHIRFVVVTMGAEGAYLFCREGIWRARVDIDPASVIKTVGSGDALMAGFVLSHAARRRPPECLRWGVACGTAATLQLRAGVINPYDVKACLEKVELTALK